MKFSLSFNSIALFAIQLWASADPARAPLSGHLFLLFVGFHFEAPAWLPRPRVSRSVSASASVYGGGLDLDAGVGDPEARFPCAPMARLGRPLRVA